MNPDELEPFGVAFNPPATAAQLQELEDAISAPLPPELREIYLHHNGMQSQGDYPFRLMSASEVADTYRELREEEYLSEDVRLFWTDDQDNYAALYVSGPAGRICLINHDEPDLTPLYRSIESFYQAMTAAARAGQDWYEMARSLASPEADALPEEQAKELALANEYFERYRSATVPAKRKSLAFKAMQLLPSSESHRLLEFLGSGDMWIQERACTLLGKRGYTAAIPALAEVARSGKHNGRIAALIALRDFGASAHEEVERLKKELEPQWLIYLQSR